MDPLTHPLMDPLTHSLMEPLMDPLMDSVNETSDYLIFQMDIDDTVTKADLSNKTWTIQYDEV